MNLLKPFSVCLFMPRLVGMFLASICLAGCLGPSVSSLAGKYQGQAVTSESEGNVVAGLQRGFASTMSLELRENKTFHMIAMVVPVDGTWTLEGNQVTLNPNAMLGLSQKDLPIATNKPMTFRVNGNILEPVTGEQAPKFRFLKEPQ